VYPSVKKYFDLENDDECQIDLVKMAFYESVESYYKVYTRDRSLVDENIEILKNY